MVPTYLMFYKQGLAASQLEERNNAWLKREERFCTDKSELYIINLSINRCFNPPNCSLFSFSLTKLISFLLLYLIPCCRSQGYEEIVKDLNEKTWKEKFGQFDSRQKSKEHLSLILCDPLVTTFYYKNCVGTTGSLK